MSDATRAEICAVALAECFRGDGEILASPIGVLPTLGARLAKLSFAPDLVITDGLHFALANVPPLGPANGFEPVIESWLPYRSVFDLLWSGRRHVVMGATQIDRFGNQNIACIGDPKRPRAQLLGMRGAPGNTLHHPTSYWIPAHGPKSFVPRVDVVCGVGYDRAAALGPQSARFHEIRRVVSNLGVFDFRTRDRSMRLVSVHPGVEVSEVVAQTGFALAIEEPVATTRAPSDAELRILRERLDPGGSAAREPLG
jgi:acyl CoA:acetate/3-ketoacid CoA transferase beta subunit